MIDTGMWFSNASKFSVDQSWGKFAKLAGQMVVDGMHGKDF